MERSPDPGGPLSRLFFGLGFAGPGLLLVGVGTGAVEVDPSTVHAPYWLIGMIGGMFTVAGLWLAARGTRLEPGLKLVVGPTILIGMLVALRHVAERRLEGRSRSVAEALSKGVLLLVLLPLLPLLLLAMLFKVGAGKLRRS